MAIGVKLKYEEIKEFIEVESNSGCRLLSEEYKNNSKKLEIICSCGEIFYTTFSNFVNKNKRQCNNCSNINRRKKHQFSYEYVKNFIEIESGSGCKLISKEYINNSTPLELLCICGKNTFWVTFQNFRKKISPTRCCSECSTYNNWNYEKVKYFVEVESNSGCILLSKEYLNIDSKLEFLCPDCGKTFNTTFYYFKYKNKRKCNKCKHKEVVDPQRLTIDYVRHFIEVESQSGCKLLSKTYSKNSHKLRILCHCGKEFKTSFSEFKGLNKRQCNKCSNHYIWTYDEIKNYIEIESNSNCKLISKEYINTTQKLDLLCKCGEPFSVSFNNFHSQNVRRCNKCAYEYISNCRKLDFDYVKNYIEIESMSNCKLLSNEYLNDQQKLKIRCECGSIFHTNFNAFQFRSKQQCDECGRKILVSKMKKSYKDVKDIIEINSNSGCKLISTEYTGYSDNNLQIKCKCGKIYTTSLLGFINGVQQCGTCSHKDSYSERTIKDFLTLNQINFKKEYTFIGCSDKKKLRFDFAVFDNNQNINILIEAHGQQHYFPVDFANKGKEWADEQFKKVQHRDDIKEKYCIKNNINLLIIPYWDFNRIPEILSKELNINNLQECVNQ